MGYPAKPFESRLKSDKATGCIEWTGGLNTSGYGHLSVAGKLMLAHRYAYTLKHGPIPQGMCVCHTCDNPVCCNVDHLFLGTHLDNMRDRTAKGRQRAPKGEESPHAKLTADQITAIRKEYAAGGISQAALGRKFGVSQTYVSDVVVGKTWAHLIHSTSLEN